MSYFLLLEHPRLDEQVRFGPVDTEQQASALAERIEGGEVDLPTVLAGGLRIEVEPVFDDIDQALTYVAQQVELRAARPTIMDMARMAVVESQGRRITAIKLLRTMASERGFAPPGLTTIGLKEAKEAVEDVWPVNADWSSLECVLKQGTITHRVTQQIRQDLGLALQVNHPQSMAVINSGSF